MRRLTVWTRYLRRFVGRPWYNPVVAALAAIDLFILIVPTDILLTSSVLLQPRRWISSFLWVSTGSAVGAAVLTALLQYGAAEFLMSHFPAIFHSEGWEGTRGFVQNHGGWALALISVSPLPQQPGVVISALSGMSIGEIFCAVWLGRALKYFTFAWLASHTPRALERFSIGRAAMREAGGGTAPGAGDPESKAAISTTEETTTKSKRSPA